MHSILFMIFFFYNFIQNSNIRFDRGKVGGDNGGQGGRVFRNMYKGHMDKTKEG